MARVASFGSVNVDRVATLDADTLASLAERYDWFPAAGETRPVESVPDAVASLVETTYLGGKGANQVVAAAAASADAVLYGCVGHDHEQVGVLETMRDRGVDTGAVGTTDSPTGTAYVFVAPDGENHIALLGGANEDVDLSYVERHLPEVCRHDCLLVQNELPVATVDALLSALDGRADRPTVLFDPAPADGAGPLLAHDCIDIVTPNETEARALGDALGDFQGTVLATHGPDPVVVSTREGEEFTVTPPPATPVDTTGAGDVFAGYVAAALAEGASLRTAVERGAVAASLSVESEGVQRAVPEATTTAAARSRYGTDDESS